MAVVGKGKGSTGNRRALSHSGEGVRDLDILLAMNGEDSYGRGGVFHPLASVGSWAGCLTSAAHVSTGVTFGLPAHRSLGRRGVYDDAPIKASPYIPGLKRRGLTTQERSRPQSAHRLRLTPHWVSLLRYTLPCIARFRQISFIGKAGATCGVSILGHHGS